MRCVTLSVIICLLVLHAAPAVPPGTENQASDKATGDARAGMSAFKVAEGLSVDLFAAEPLLSNPVAIDVDARGDVYVAETERFGQGVSDNRPSRFWLHDDLAAQTVEDRLAYYRKWAEAGKRPMNWYTDHEDRVRIVYDTDGDGRADKSKVFAGPFNDPLDGLGSGVLATGGEVYYTNIPNLYKLTDTDGDRVADQRKVLSTGHGVRTAFLGHDSHGVIRGFDGKLYFSVGDRGLNIPLPDGSRLRDKLDVGRGAVLRCNLDGSDIEIFYHGLRNPQELAFDDYGNLFTGDNNSDAGDKARIVYCLEGGDAGWVMSYQYMEHPYLRGPWHEEQIWHLENEDQPAWTLPPVAHIASGPSGFAAYPGVGFDDSHKGNFYLVDYRGQSASSGVWSFKLKPDGAGFKVENLEKLLWGVGATDITFGYDGRAYISDWTGGWSVTNRGRIYTLADPERVGSDAVRQVTKLFEAGFDKLAVDRLVALLDHADRRVRLEAQFTLADKNAGEALLKVARDANAPQLARIHAIWGYGQLEPFDGGKLTALLSDSDPQIVIAATRVLGNHHTGDAQVLANLNSHADPRVRLHSAMTWGKMPHDDTAKAIEPLIALLRQNNDEDRFLRHAAVMGLTWISDLDATLQYASDDSPAVRMGVLLTLRRHSDARLARFLEDAESDLVTEAARAIHDLQLTDAMGALAGVLDRYQSQAQSNERAEKPFSVAYYNNVTGNVDALRRNERYPDKPSLTHRARTFESLADRADHYGMRIAGYVTAPQDGQYIFHISADDYAELTIGEAPDDPNKKVIASVPQWTALYQWNKHAAQQSEPVTLKKGQRVYLEAVGVENGGQDHIAVGWKLPDGTLDRPIGAGADRTNSADRPSPGRENRPLLRRAMAANFRLGETRHAERLARFIASDYHDAAMTHLALNLLSQWTDPNPVDSVIGAWWPLPKRSAQTLRPAVADHIPAMLDAVEGDIEAQLVRLTDQLQIALDEKSLIARVKDKSQPVNVRAVSLGQLAKRGSDQLAAMIDLAINSDEPRLRHAGRLATRTAQPGSATGPLINAAERATVTEKQLAYEALASMPGNQVDTFLASKLRDMAAGKLDPAVQLELIQAAEQRKAPAVASALKQVQPMIAQHTYALAGGDAEAGQAVFTGHPTAQCMRCHRIDGEGGQAGPDLSTIGAKVDRAYLLQSLVNPNAKIAEGFDTIVLNTKKGATIAGTLKNETDDQITIAQADGRDITVDKSAVATRTAVSVSAMPPMGALLSKDELRDVIEFLATRR